MDDSEHDQLDEIHNEVQGSNAQLGAIAERTRSIQKSLEDINEDVAQNQSDINDLQNKVRRNTVIINGVTVGLGSVLLWISDKLSRLNPF
jgi:predicted  nucleic acid-binding Zn-ribbon protein